MCNGWCKLSPQAPVDLLGAPSGMLGWVPLAGAALPSASHVSHPPPFISQQASPGVFFPGEEQEGQQKWATSLGA